MDVEPHRSERGDTKGTFIVEEEWNLPKGEGSFGVQPLSMIQAEDANSKKIELFDLNLTDRTSKAENFCKSENISDHQEYKNKNGGTDQ